jgi:hypothetical protein
MSGCNKKVTVDWSRCSNVGDGGMWININIKTESMLFWDINAVLSGSSVPTFRVNLSVPLWSSCPMKMGPIGFPETSVQNYHSTRRNAPEESR